MIYSQFWENGRKAEVIKEDGIWGAIFYEEGAKVEQRMFKGHSEAYAESAAENWVLRVIQ